MDRLGTWQSSSSYWWIILSCSNKRAAREFYRVRTTIHLGSSQLTMRSSTSNRSLIITNQWAQKSRKIIRDTLPRKKAQRSRMGSKKCRHPCMLALWATNTRTWYLRVPFHSWSTRTSMKAMRTSQPFCPSRTKIHRGRLKRQTPLKTRIWLFGPESRMSTSQTWSINSQIISSQARSMPQCWAISKGSWLTWWAWMSVI